MLLVALSAPSSAEVVFRRFEFETPRDFGYFIGDVVRHRVHLELSHPYRLDQTQLLEEGRYDRWLESDKALVNEYEESDHVRYEIELVYRIVNNPDAAIAVFTPKIPLLARGQGQSLTKDTPAWAFTVSPLDTRGAGEGTGVGSIRPDSPPPALGVTSAKIVIAAALAALLGLFAHWFHARWGLPGSARRRRSFARAHRDLRALARQPASGALYAESLRRFHMAVNDAAGKVIFAGDLESFFSGHPCFEVCRPRIEALYRHSAEVFFKENPTPEPKPDDLRALLQLARECRLAER